jgi:hypothetical protein
VCDALLGGQVADIFQRSGGHARVGRGPKHRSDFGKSPDILDGPAILVKGIDQQKNMIPHPSMTASRSSRPNVRET